VSKKNHRQCEICGRWFEVSLGDNGKRADTRFCDHACINKAYRRRQKMANEMRTAGKTLREIEKATGTKMKTLKKWLKPKDK
jgi:hypothetical protein